LDLFLLLPKFAEFLSLIQQIAPQPLAQASGALAQEGPAAWQHAIEEFWHGEPELARGEDDTGQAQFSDRVLAWIFLQPYAECLADHREIAVADGTPSTCPLCGGKPAVGVLRSEGDGAKKSLICMLCAHEWAFRRIYCPACGEEREPQMAYYSAPEIAHVRVDVCDTCHTYLKSIDLTKTGLAVAIVDELATTPLDLWAREHGYEKLQINLLGT
jgi:formate dehydrogenase maturation protein FdhE